MKKNDGAARQLDFPALEALLASTGETAIFCHINPDGDCIGAMLALSRALKARGAKSPVLFSLDGIPMFLEFLLLPGETVVGAEKAKAEYSGRIFDTVILVDTATKKRAGEAFFPLMDSAGKTICIDHHGTNGGSFAMHNFIDGEASSTCEVLYRFFSACGWEIPEEIAGPLYCGIMYDTGRFMHSNTTPDVMSICSGLIAAGANPSHIAGHVYRDRPLAHLRILGYALSNMRTSPDGRIAWATLPRSVFRQLGATDADTEGIVEAIGAYKECEVHVVFTEGPDGLSRVSSRSTGHVKVSEICSLFGGGGHQFASGIRTSKPLEEIERLFIEEAQKRLP